MRIVVVRHGQAEPKKGWAGTDEDRPLVARGRRQAGRLGQVVGRRPPDRVISSPALRCRQTVQPLADQRGVEVEVDEALARGAGPAAAELCRELLAKQPDDSTVVLCTHREVLVDLLPRLAAELGPKLGPNLGHRPPGAKGGAWILRLRGGKLEKVDYRPPAA
jgi:broad specificity phosphatase PhoE